MTLTATETAVHCFPCSYLLCSVSLYYFPEQCGIACEHEGTASPDCTSCECPAPFIGDTCGRSVTKNIAPAED